MDDSLCLHIPVHFHSAATGQHHHDIGVHRCHCIQQSKLIFRQLHVGTVNALRFASFVQTQPQQNCFCILCQIAGLTDQHSILFAAPAESGSKAGHIGTDRLQRIQTAVQLGGVDLGAARPLVSGIFCEIADNSNFLCFVQRQYFFLVLQQNSTLFCHFGSHCMMGIPVIGLAGDMRLRGQNQIQQSIHLLIQNGFFQFPFPDSLYNVPIGLTVGGGHFQSTALPDGLHPVIIAAPVRNYHAVEVPFSVENVPQQMGMLMGIDAVNPVVGGHQRSDAALFYRHFKGWQVDLPEGTFIHNGVIGHTPQLLGVGGIMLDAGRNAVGLNAPDESSRHLAGEIRIL